ncbi:hypothetical protein [Haliangium sp.]|uniref:hypothetical protein n=1 Tax=Haliangium sp. TaxID=2663208 RepID=UPI003D0E27D7
MSREQEQRPSSRQDSAGAKDSQKSRVAPGKVTRTGGSGPAAGASVQRKASAAGAGASAPAKSAWDWTNDPRMDVAHRGPVQAKPAASGSAGAVVQREEGDPAVDQTEATPEEGFEAPTSTPDNEADATAQARAEITAFMARTYCQERYVTANGYGAFDLHYSPQSSVCTVTVPIEFDFQNAPPSIMMKYLGLTTLDKLVECVWTDAKREAFKQDMVTQVSRVWSGKHQLKCTYDNPDLTDEMCPTWSDVVANISVAPRAVESGGYFKVKVLALPKADAKRSFVSGSDHRKTAGGAAGEVSESGFNQTGGQFNSSDNEKKKIGSSFGGPQTEQVTTAHEFGHMLGQDDQYVDTGRTAGSTNDSGSRVSQVPADEQRIMDGGEVVQTDHYSTIKDALNAATTPITFDF